MVNVANQLNIDASDVETVMIAKEGSKVSKNDLIAQTNGIFGYFKSSVNSPVEWHSRVSFPILQGQIVIREAPIPVEVDAYIRGIVHEVITEEGVVIKSYGSFVQGIFGIGGESRGKIKMLSEDRSSEISADMILPEHEGMIIVGGSFISLEAYKKALECKVAGVVVGGFNLL